MVYSSQHAGLGERAGQKIILQGELADLGVQLLQVHRRWRCRFGAEHAGRALEQLVLPINNLVGMHIVQLGQLGQGSSRL